MSLLMTGFVDAVFVSVPATRTAMTGGGYVDGIFVPGTLTTSPYVVNIQPVSERELDFLQQGGERIVDPRRIYINDGNMQLIDQTGEWEFLGQRWKAHRSDNRYWRDYCKCIVSRIDDQ
jgi:hypothetical protein